MARARLCGAVETRKTHWRLSSGVAIELVEVAQDIAMPAARSWAILRDFCRPWHPRLDAMRAESGGTARTFSVKGEDGLYQERLTWFSDSDRALCYTHVFGIDGVQRYDARIEVRPINEDRCRVHWQAEIEAAPPRCQEIAQGTKAIFRAGLQALAQLKIPAFVKEASGGTVTPKAQQIGPLCLLTAVENTGPLCLFLHGIGGQKENWSPQVRVTADVLPAAALDLRGYGGSDLGPAASTIDDYCQDILAVRQAQGADRLV